MNTLIVDDKQLAVNSLTRIMENLDPQGCHVGVLCADDALVGLETINPDVVFLDVEMPDVDGITLAKEIKKRCHHTNIIFVTGHPKYALAAHGIFASGFLTKPIGTNDVSSALENLRYPLELARHHKIQIRCFGNFDVFANGVPLNFKRSRTQEMFAYLVDRQGSRCSIGELVGILWSQGVNTNSQRAQLRNLIHDLRCALAEVDAEDVLIRERGFIAIRKDLVDCDYYSFLNGDPHAINLYQGEYMSQYSWAEITTGTLPHTEDL